MPTGSSSESVSRYESNEPKALLDRQKKKGRSSAFDSTTGTNGGKAICGNQTHQQNYRNTSTFELTTSDDGTCLSQKQSLRQQRCKENLSWKSSRLEDYVNKRQSYPTLQETTLSQQLRAEAMAAAEIKDPNGVECLNTEQPRDQEGGALVALAEIPIMASPHKAKGEVFNFISSFDEISNDH